MKKILTMLLSMGTFCAAMAQTIEVSDLEMPVAFPYISIYDYDTDGDYDVYITGLGDSNIDSLLNNDGQGNFTTVKDDPFTAFNFGAFNWLDFNLDNKPDVFSNGRIGTGFSGSSEMFINDGEGGWIDFEEAGQVFRKVGPGSAVGDLDNDGDQDIVLLGSHDGGKSAIYYNDGNGGVKEDTTLFDGTTWRNSAVQILDINNDTYPDISVVVGYDNINDLRYVKIFYNNGDGTFTEDGLSEVIAKGFGKATWGDYDADGDFDLLLNGDGGANSGEGAGDIYRLYQNNDGTFTEATTFTSYRSETVAQGGNFIDWDNDGDLDISVIGYSNTATAPLADIFLNDGNGNFTAYDLNGEMFGVSRGASAFGDLDGDGALDMVVAGLNAGNKTSRWIKNPTSTTNAAPAAPTNLEISVDTTTVTFSWDAATDDSTPQASLTYNLFLLDSAGNYVVSPLADTVSGHTFFQGYGNTFLNTSWTVHGLDTLATYRWGVQAIDNSYAASAFATASFEISDSSSPEEEEVLAIEEQHGALVYPNPSYGLVKIKATEGLRDIMVLSLDGRQVYSQSVTRGSKVELSLPQGIYLLKARYADGLTRTERIIVLD